MGGQWDDDEDGEVMVRLPRKMWRDVQAQAKGDGNMAAAAKLRQLVQRGLDQENEK